jgi:hypothetical protein
MELDALEQSLRLLEPALAHAQLREADEWEHPQRAVAALRHPQRRQQLALRLGPAPDRREDPAVVHPAHRRHEDIAGALDEPVDHRHPLLRSQHVARVLARAQHAAVDVAGGDDAGHLAAGHGRHRRVDHRHAGVDAPGVDTGLAEQRQRAELEIHVAEAPPDVQCSRGKLLALRRIRDERRLIEREPPVLRSLVEILEQRAGAREPALRGSPVAVYGAVQECQPARLIGCLQRTLPLEAQRERALARRERSLEIAAPLKCLRVRVERVDAFLAALHVRALLPAA